jgi:hypothetical protein
VCLLGGAPLPSLFPIQSITVTLTDNTTIQLDGAAARSAQRYAPFAQDDLLRFCRNQVLFVECNTLTLLHSYTQGTEADVCSFPPLLVERTSGSSSCTWVCTAGGPCGGFGRTLAL